MSTKILTEKEVLAIDVDSYRHRPSFPYCLPSNDHSIIYPVSEFMVNDQNWLCTGRRNFTSGDGQRRNTIDAVNCKDFIERTYECYRRPLSERLFVELDGREINAWNDTFTEWTPEILEKYQGATIKPEEAHAFGLRKGHRMHVIYWYNPHFALVRIDRDKFKSMFHEDFILDNQSKLF